MARRPEAGGEARSALALPALLALALCAPGAGGQALEWYSAVVSLEYLDRQTNRTVCSVSESGRFGDSSPKEGALGLVGVPSARDGDPEGCAPDTRFVVPAPGGRGAAPWVALVARGGCTFKDKVLVAARRNASAVVIYNQERHGNLTAPLSHAGERAGRGRAGVGDPGKPWICWRPPGCCQEGRQPTHGLLHLRLGPFPRAVPGGERNENPQGGRVIPTRRVS